MKEGNKEEDTLDTEILSKLIVKAKKLKWQDWVLILCILTAFIIFFNHINSYQQLPSPVFGGDYFRDRGFIKNIRGQSSMVRWVLCK